MRRIDTLIGAVSISASTSTSVLSVTRLNSTEYPLAACLDGSPYPYYFQNGSNSSKFVVWLMGGGDCGTAQACAARSGRAASGLEQFWPDELPMSTYLPEQGSRNASYNPLLFDANIAFLPYCDGGYFGGQVRDPVLYGNRKLYLRGRHNLEGTIQHLLQYRGLDDATEVIVGGCSAGAMAVFLHLDRIAGLLPKARVGGLSDSGYYLFEPTSTPGWAEPEVAFHNFSGLLNRECVAAQPAGAGWRCLQTDISAPYLKTPLFAMQSRFDINQLSYSPCHSIPASKATYGDCVNAYGANLTESIRRWLAHTLHHGAFIDGCSRHCQHAVAAGPTANGTTNLRALEDWWRAPPQQRQADRQALWEQRGAYPCASCCQQLPA